MLRETGKALSALRDAERSCDEPSRPLNKTQWGGLFWGDPDAEHGIEDLSGCKGRGQEARKRGFWAFEARNQPERGSFRLEPSCAGSVKCITKTDRSKRGSAGRSQDDSGKARGAAAPGLSYCRTSTQRGLSTRSRSPEVRLTRNPRLPPLMAMRGRGRMLAWANKGRAWRIPKGDTPPTW